MFELSSDYHPPGDYLAVATALAFQPRGSLRKFLTRYHRILPASRRRDPLDLGRSPGFWFILKHRRAGLQHRVNDSPRFLHIILAGEQSGVAGHRVPQHAFVGKAAMFFEAVVCPCLEVVQIPSPPWPRQPESRPAAMAVFARMMGWKMPRRRRKVPVISLSFFPPLFPALPCADGNVLPTSFRRHVCCPGRRPARNSTPARQTQSKRAGDDGHCDVLLHERDGDGHHQDGRDATMRATNRGALEFLPEPGHVARREKRRWPQPSQPTK